VRRAAVRLATSARDCRASQMEETMSLSIEGCFQHREAKATSDPDRSVSLVCKA
jgi:hypothetical protein